MRKLCSCHDMIECDILKSRLESNGIRCVMKNELVAPLAGAVPFGDVWPELWVDEADFDKALEFTQGG
jgi:hypothetical protein